MKTIKSVLENRDFTKQDKYLTRDFQEFGLKIAEELNDFGHKALYIKLAKTKDRAILQSALSFVVDSQARNKGALFMWKLKELNKKFADAKTMKELVV